MRPKPLLIDAFCCQGGAGKGYADAGFDIVGIDVNPQPRYPYEFIQGDVFDALPRLLADRDVSAIHGSPPCQHYSKTQRIRDNEHPDLIAPFRDLCLASGLPYVIENVEDARPWLRDPFTLCGAMFPELRVYRHRLFETNFRVAVPEHPEHAAKLRKMGRPPQPDEFMHVVGNFSGVAQAKIAMGIDWMSRDGLRESIPPAYTHYIGRDLALWLRCEATPDGTIERASA